MTSDRKQALRAQIRERLQQLSAGELAAADAAIIRRLLGLDIWRQAQNIFCYLAVGREIATLPLLEAAWAAGKQLAAPLIIAPGLMEARCIDSLASLRTDRYGIPAPPPEAPLLTPQQIDLAIVPGVAFDRRSLRRLGRGGGYYDRYLAATPAVRIGLAREVQLVESDFPAEEHDLAMNLLISESALYLPQS